MTPDEARALVADVLAGIAPEVDLATIDPSASMQQELDLDSIDVLNLMTGLHDRTGIEIPERDHAQLTSLDGCVAYLTGHAP
jgi:acyl carrier protein